MISSAVPLMLPQSCSGSLVHYCLLSLLIQEHTNYGIAIKCKFSLATFYSSSYWEGDMDTCSQFLPRAFLTGAEQGIITRLLLLYEGNKLLVEAGNYDAEHS